ncbi:glycosyltransferase family 2 protein [Aquibium microcysteis]|uniref:glycosyltransferase family 2 protein n=1 Tax=Aquibium microcysteis TaxID=675281 RepID=UPI00165D1FDF|nr:glycosyltransferase family 2 protein [Aquibium microcysteis]
MMEKSTNECSDASVLPIDPTVSVLMLTYNHEKYIAQAIEGVVRQECGFAIELVIADDSSTDATLEIVREYQARYPNIIRVLTAQSNVGIYSNYKRALAACRGEWIAFCEGDDYWIDGNKLSLQIGCINTVRGVDISFHSCMIQYGDSSDLVGPVNRVSSRNRIIKTQDVIFGGGSFMPTASILVKAQMLKDMPSWLSECGGAIDVYVQAYGARNGGALYIDRPMSVYRRGVAGSWTEVMARDPKGFNKFWIKRIDLLRRMAADFRIDRKAVYILIGRELMGIIERSKYVENREVFKFVDTQAREIASFVPLYYYRYMRIIIESPHRWRYLWVRTIWNRWLGRARKLAVTLRLM